jgi:hypothetical protein
MYLSGDHVTGKYDRATAEALLRFRMDQRDANIKGPLARSGPMLNRLAQGQSLAVLEGTAIPYKLATDQALVTGTITHLWTDPGYNFDPGQIFHRESQILEKHGKARPFPWKAKWRDEVEGLLQIENAFSPNAVLRWISFEARPIS